MALSTQVQTDGKAEELNLEGKDVFPQTGNPNEFWQS